VFEKLAQFEMQTSELKGMKQGRLKIAAISPINYLTARLLNPFCHRYPGIHISLDVLNSEQMLKQLAENTNDLYLMSDPPANAGFHSQPFIENPLVVIAPQHHPLANQRNLTIDQLRGESFVMREPGSATRHAVQTWLNQHDVPVRVQFEVGNNEAIKQMVIYGLGISIVSHHAIVSEVANGQLVVLDIQGFPISRRWYAVYPSSKQLSIVARTFLQFLEGEVNDATVLAA
jgi:DNA-binding transcriptional LysR family regulator